MTENGVSITLARWEGNNLRRLVDDFLTLLRHRDTDDAAVARLAPNAYPDDAEAATEFAASTRDDLLDRRALEAMTIRRDLGAFDIDDPSDEAPASDSLAERLSREIITRVTDADAWLRTLTAIRLVIAERLELTSDEPSSSDTRHDVLDWLGYRLDELVRRADEADEAESRLSG